MCRTNWSLDRSISTKSSSKKTVPCCNPFAAIQLLSCSANTSCCNDNNRHPNLITICMFMSLELLYKCFVSYRSLASSNLFWLHCQGPGFDPSKCICSFRGGLWFVVKPQHSEESKEVHIMSLCIYWFILFYSISIYIYTYNHLLW